MMNLSLKISLLLSILAQIASGQECEANFSFQQNGNSFSFTDQSTIDAGDEITSWAWDFDDGSTSSSQNPSHTFPGIGRYDVELEIETQEGCKDKTSIRIFICDLRMTATTSACNNSEAILNVNITDAGGFVDDISLNIDNELAASGVFSNTGTITFEIPIIGDGVTHTLEAVSPDFASCQSSVEFTYPNCQSDCFLSGLTIENTQVGTQTVSIGDNFFNPQNLNITLGEVVTFNWVGGSQHSTTSDATTGPDSWNSGERGAGSTYDVKINNTGLHRYYCIPHGGPGGQGMSGTIVANCPSGTSLDLTLNFNTTVAGIGGFEVLVDGAVTGQTRSYKGTGLNSTTLSYPGDGKMHSIGIRDVGDPTCILTQDYQMPDCGQTTPCQIAVSASVGSCNAQNNVPVQVTVSAINPTSPSFQILVDGSVTGTFSYNASGTNVETVSVSGDGNMHSITVRDQNNNSCSSSTTISTPNCSLPCGIDRLSIAAGASTTHTIEVRDFEFFPKTISVIPGDMVRWIWVGDVAHTTTSDATSGNDSWASALQGKGSTFETTIETVGTHRYYCEPHGDPGGQGMSGVINAAADCQNNQVSVTYQFSAQNTSLEGYNIYVDGSQIGGARAYGTSGNTEGSVLVDGDGRSHTVEIRDAVNTNCRASTSVTTSNCTEPPECILDLALGSGRCEAQLWMQGITVSSLNPSGNAFEILLDNTAVQTISYNNIDGEILVSVPGDGESHTISVRDVSNPACGNSITFSAANCNMTCVLENLSLVDQGFVTHEIEVRDFEFSPKALDVKVGDHVRFVWTGNVAHTTTSDATSGNTQWSSPLLNKGDTYEVTINDPGLHPYYCIPHGGPNGHGMAGIINAKPDCDQGMAALTFTFNAPGKGQSGFNVFQDGQQITSTLIPYASTNTNFFTVEVLGDGEMHTFSIVDATDPLCMISTMARTPLCTDDNPCTLLNLEVTDRICEADSVLVRAKVTHLNNGTSFELSIDGNAYKRINYNDSSITEFEFKVIPDTATHTIQIIDNRDENCSSTFSFENIICSSECSLLETRVLHQELTRQTILVRDFDFFPDNLEVLVGDTIDFVWTGDVPHTTTSDKESGADSWSSSLLGNGSTYTIVLGTPGDHGYYCIPHGAPGGQGMSGNITARLQCQDSQARTLLEATSQPSTGQVTNLTLDGVLQGQYKLEADGKTVIPIWHMGDSQAHRYELSSPDNDSCTLSGTFMATNCDDPCIGFAANFSTRTGPNFGQYTFVALGESGVLNWTFSDGKVDTGKMISHSFSEPGSYTVCLVAENAGCSAMLCDTISYSEEDFCLFRDPSFSFTLDSNGYAVQFSPHFEYLDARYLWGFGDGEISTALNPTHTYLLPNDYTVCLLVQDTELGCNSHFCTEVTTLTTNTIDDFLQPVHVFPNPLGPGRDLLNIRLPALLGGKNILFQIVSMSGQTIKTGSLNSNTESVVNINTLEAGIYSIIITHETHVYRTKFVKLK